MPSKNERLFKVLQAVQRPGNFYATGTLEVFPPHLEVEGVGRIALPLLPVQAEQLAAIAEVAPYGLGADTLVDPLVRRTWQIDAHRITLGGKHWQDNLDDMVNRAATGLGIAGGVSEELYKLLVYDKGSFFISHRDTEKAAGMFATLVVVLPSEYSGGELIIKHQQQQVKLDLHRDDSSEIAFAAFYADCVHEVLPVTQGCRLTLIYNLCRADKKLPLPRPPDYQREQGVIAGLLRDWLADLDSGTHQETPEKLIYLLEHAYTSAELGFDALKGVDSAVADTLLAATDEANCDLHLALVSVEENGSAEYAGNGRYWEEDDFEEGEIFERIETVSEWRRPDGNPSNLPILPFSADEFCPPDAFSEIEPDDVQFSEATGNAGASFERTYHCAALVIWPKSRYLAIINQAGLSATLPVLRDFCQRLETEDKDKLSNLWLEAHRLAGYMQRDWLDQYLSNRNPGADNSNVQDFLDCLYRMQDREILSKFWSMLAEHGFYRKDIIAILLKTIELLPWHDVVNWTQQAIHISADRAQEACAAWLACLSANHAVHDLRVAAQSLFMSLPGDQTKFTLLLPWERDRMRASVELVADVLTGFSAIDADMAEEVLDYMFAWPDIYAMHSILLPVALQLTEAATSRNMPVVRRLRQVVQTHLHARVAETLEAPADLRRDNKVGCKCQDCAQLRVFLDNPAQSTWRFKAAEARRRHVEQAVRHSDVDCATERTGSPHTLVCIKNQASYLRRVAQRKNDLDALARLAVEN